MKAIIQRVTRASVTVGDDQISSIGRGLCVLLGISVEDTHTDAEYIIRKILNLRLFEDENGRPWSKCVMDRDFEVLCVSQFTLQCILKGNKPDFHLAMPAELAQPFYASILENMRSAYKPELVQDGKFGAFMKLHIQNDGPVTIELTSPPSSDPRQPSTSQSVQSSNRQTIVPESRIQVAVVQQVNVNPLSPSVTCQTDVIPTRTVGTQLSYRTLRPHIRSEGVKATVLCKDFGVGTSNTDPLCLSSTQIKRPTKRPRLEFEEELEDGPLENSSLFDRSKPHHYTYDPAQSVTGSFDSTLQSKVLPTPAHQINKYIVYEDCILELFNKCPVCTKKCDVRPQRLGTYLSVKQSCPHCTYGRQWSSQPVLGSTPAGNVHLSAAVYLSGASFIQLEKVFKAMKLQMFKYETFRHHVRCFIEPAVIHHWKVQQNEILQRLSEEGKVILGGGMRTESPGHSANYGSYTMMDLKTNTVVDLQLVQSNEVGSSDHMQKEGLKRSLALMESRGISIDCVVTDRQPQVRKFLREQNITHYYDVCHIAKGIVKKLDAISKTKGCEKLKLWIKSINNHIYWTAASCASGPERIARWNAILNHVQDIHTHEEPLYPTCEHEIRKTTDKSKWLQADTPAFNKLDRVLRNKRMLKDVAKLNPHRQTSSLESFHSLIFRFAPQNVVFPFIGMLCRLYLAAIHYNENAERLKAETRTREDVPRYKLSFPKANHGECKAKPPETQSTFGYVADLMDLIFEEVIANPVLYIDTMLAIPVPKNLSPG
ncbi:uncharacterized protein LOC144020186 isoform X2 [Festucalex cinctus]